MVDSTDDVKFDIILESQKAVQRLIELSKLTNDVRVKMDAAKVAVMQFATQAGTSISYAVSLFKQLDKLASSTKKTSAVFGGMGGNAWTEVGREASKASKAAAEVGTASEKAGKQAESGWQKAVSAVNILRIAMGALVSMLLFQAIQAVTSFFTTAIQQAREFEATLYRISNAERQLSMEGVEVSVKELKKGIDDIKNAFPIFSKEDIAELIGGIATTTKELGFTGQEILKLGAAVAILNINSTEAETLLQTMGKVSNSLVSPAAKSIGNLGLSFGKAKMEAKAFELQILKTGETFDALTEREKSQIKFEIVLETAGIEGIDDLEKLRDIIKEMGGDFEALDKYLESNDAKLAANAAAWKDLQTVVGQIILPFIPVLTGFFQLISDGFTGSKIIIIEFVTLLGALGTALFLVFTGQIKNMKEFGNVLELGINTLRESLVNTFFKEMPKDAPEFFKRGWGDLIREDAETATSGIDTFGEAVENIDSEALSKIDEKLRDIATDAENARADLETKFNQKTSDIDLEYVRKQADAERDYARKREDINRDAEREIANLRDDHRQDDIRAEEEYQNKLWELRMRFLLNLEDALHARDARQVIRLQKEYEIDKEALENKKELEDQQREEDQRNQLEDIEIKRQQRLEDAQIEFQEKLADQQLAKQRELADLNVWYDRERADLELSIERRLKAVIDGWLAEEGATAQGAAAVYALLLKYFGPGGLTDQIAQYMFGQLGQAAAQLAQIGSLNYGLGQANQTNPFQGQYQTPELQYDYTATSPTRFAEGGSLLATRPTNVTFGEAGAEMATFTPLSKIGRNTGKIFGDGSGGGTSGQILVEVFLSPDLEARIIDASMDGVGEIISRVTRSKV